MSNLGGGGGGGGGREGEREREGGREGGKEGGREGEKRSDRVSQASTATELPLSCTLMIIKTCQRGIVCGRCGLLQGSTFADDGQPQHNSSSIITPDQWECDINKLNGVVAKEWCSPLFKYTMCMWMTMF